MLLSDIHLHSDFSSDSQTPMEEMVLHAIKLGLERICFTDHIDYDYPIMADGTLFEFDVDQYLSEIERLQAKYGDRLKVLKGLELGLKTDILSKLHTLTKNHRFDFIIGSSHIVFDKDPYYPDYWENISVHDGLMNYFQNIIDTAQAFDDFDTYGHIDYIVRYIPAVKNKTAPLSDFYSYAKYADILDTILETIINAGKALEVNTAGYKYGLGQPNPNQDIIRRYFELGGKLITIGSDGHCPEHMAYDFEKVKALLLQIGVREYAIFEDRKPILLPLE